MKKLYKTVVIVLSILFVVVFTVKVINQNSIEDSLKFKKEYEALNHNINNYGENIKLNISKDNPMVYSNLTEILEIIKNGTGVIYFGFPECPWCRNALPILLDASEKNEIDRIYYLNPKEYRSKLTNEYEELIEILKPYLSKDENGNKKLYVPDVYFVKNGKIIGNNLGTVDSQKDPYTPLNNEQREELYNVYGTLMKQIK